MSDGARDEDPAGYWPFGWEAPTSPAPTSPGPARPARRRRASHAGSPALSEARVRPERVPSTAPAWRLAAEAAAGRLPDVALLLLSLVVLALVVLALR